MSLSTEPKGPLVGFRVLELGSTIAGPVCARLFADFGADVIKVEPPEGDAARNIGVSVEGVSLYSASMSRNKRAAIIDIRKPEGRDLFLDLAQRSHVVIENLRPGTMERLGLGYAELSKRNPGIVLVRISGYGQSGPYREMPGYGAICEAIAGVRHMTGDPDRPPARVALAVTDYLTAVYAAFGAVMALLDSQKTGLGQVIDAALYEAAFSMMEEAVPSYAKAGVIPTRQGPKLMNLAPNSLYPTKDGTFILIAANNDVIFRRLAIAMDQRALADDPRYKSQRARGERVDEVDNLVMQWTLKHDGAEVQRLLVEAQVPVSRIYTIKDIFEDQHYKARQMLLQLPHPKIGEITVSGVVPKLSRSPGAVYRAGPALGEDTRDVLMADLGISAARLAELEASEVVVCAQR
jgi:crotonobetainyl-CoA:carnitine CoA-transferase CaiB-like acyl-CoA transferase